MRKALKVIGAILGGAVVLFGSTAFLIGNPAYIPFGIAFMAVGAVLLFFCLRRSPEDKARAEVRRAAKAQRRQTMVEEARLDEQRRQEEKERQRQTQRQARQEEKERSPQSQWAAWKEARAQRRAGIREKRAQGVPCCPFCGCTSLSSQKRGYRVGKGVLWGVLLAAAGFWLFAFIGAGIGFAIGLSAGSVGSGQVYCTCLSCGRRFRAGFRW